MEFQISHGAIAHLTPALKEWSVAVDALATGETILLLRKGGIREHQGRFSVEHHHVVLYPTYEHQRPELLKTARATQPDERSSPHSSSISIKAWAEITQVHQITEVATVEALAPFHIWNEQFVTTRFHWKPRQPLYALLLRVYRFTHPPLIQYSRAYEGCKSWIMVQADEPLLDLESTPVLTVEAYNEQVARILAAIRQSDPSTNNGE